MFTSSVRSNERVNERENERVNEHENERVNEHENERVYAFLLPQDWGRYRGG